MTNPFSNTERAFEPFFTDCVEFLCNRAGSVERTTVRACVMPEEKVQPFMESDLDSDMKIVSIVVARRDWPYNKPMKTGDKVRQIDMDEWLITDVSLYHDMYRITARSVK